MDMFYEWNGVTRGHQWFDWVLDRDGNHNDLLIWIGGLHVVMSWPAAVQRA